MLSNFILSAILVICVFIYIKFCINRFKFYKLVDKIPGPPRFPIPGIEGISLLKDLFGKNNQGKPCYYSVKFVNLKSYSNGSFLRSKTTIC